jgi:uncharacterized protein (DUF58 family)
MRHAALADLRSVAAAGALLCLLAALFATSALYVPGIALLLAAALAPIWVRLASARACVELEPGTLRAYEGERVSLSVAARRGILSVGCAELRVGELSVPLPAGRALRRLAFSAVAERRGMQPLGPACLRLSDPLGICVRELRSNADELLVLPRVYPVGAGVLDRVQRVSTRAMRTDAQLHLDSLRASDASVPAARIHWPTVARTGELMAREFVADAQPRVLILVDARVPASEEALDCALRAAASLCVHLARSGGCELLLPGEARPHTIGTTLEGWPALHARMALVRAGTHTPGARSAQRSRTVIHVTAAAGGGVGGVARSADACWRVGPHPLAGLPIAFDLAGCAGQLLEDASASRTAA